MALAFEFFLRHLDQAMAGSRRETLQTKTVSRAVLSTACALFCFSESTSSMPARDWQCRGQSFLLLVLSKDNVLLQSSLCSNGCGTDDDDDDDGDDDDDNGMPIGRCELELS